MTCSETNQSFLFKHRAVNETANMGNASWRLWITLLHLSKTLHLSSHREDVEQLCAPARISPAPPALLSPPADLGRFGNAQNAKSA